MGIEGSIGWGRFKKAIEAVVDADEEMSVARV
jgi:hypothetical protein